MAKLIAAMKRIFSYALEIPPVTNPELPSKFGPHFPPKKLSEKGMEKHHLSPLQKDEIDVFPTLIPGVCLE